MKTKTVQCPRCKCQRKHLGFDGICIYCHQMAKERGLTEQIESNINKQLKYSPDLPKLSERRKEGIPKKNLKIAVNNLTQATCIYNHLRDGGEQNGEPNKANQKDFASSG